ncbi:MAG: ComEC/Rec2 family competence protein [Solirubrobacterales bacterium]
MPKVTANTANFKDIVQAISNKGLKAKLPTEGENFKLGDASCIILGPINTVSGNMNTYSIVIKVTFGNNKFLFTGDAQKSNEEDMIIKGVDLRADVLKVGHHGSETSSSDDFVNKVNPKYAVISCGLGNDYGHPHKTTMDKLQSKGIAVFRTDECGTIVCTSDGNKITFSVNQGDYKYGSKGESNSSGTVADSLQLTSSSAAESVQKQSEIVYVANSGKKYHRANCSSLCKSKIAISLEDAKKDGYTPCLRCNPPQ